ncbi:MAG: helix-turn-helix domain-containing protein [Parcubacteria group bacterium]|jgi:sugar-specific transcriptional regulator TrmB
MLLSTLKQVGLSEKQAKIYLAALELGETTVKEIAKKAEIKRTTIYDLLSELLESGIMKQTVRGVKKRFIAASPEDLQVLIQKRAVLLAQIMPNLDSMSNVDKVRPKVRFYEGRAGLAEVYADTLKHSGEILAFASDDVAKVLGLDWAGQYIRQRMKKKIYYKGIVARSALIEKEFATKNQEQLRSIKMIDSHKYPFSNEVMIYGHQKIAIISAKDAMGIIIESAEIFLTQKSIFELLWDLLPEIKI